MSLEVFRTEPLETLIKKRGASIARRQYRVQCPASLRPSLRTVGESRRSMYSW